MARVVQLKKTLALGDETLQLDLRAANAYGVVFQGWTGGSGTFQAFGGDTASQLRTLICESTIAGVPSIRLAEFGVPALWDFLTFIWAGGGGGYDKASGIALLDEPVTPWGHCHSFSQSIVALAAGAQNVNLGSTFRGTARALEFQITGNKAFSMLLEQSICGVTIGPNVIGRVTTATGGLLTLILPAPDNSITMRLRNDDGAVAGNFQIHSRALFSESHETQSLQVA